jgi:hypothetical protein
VAHDQKWVCEKAAPSIHVGCSGRCSWSPRSGSRRDARAGRTALPSRTCRSVKAGCERISGESAAAAPAPMAWADDPDYARLPEASTLLTKTSEGRP